MYPKDLLILINFLRKLPGVGSKTAERFAFNLLNWDEESLKTFGKTLQEVKAKIAYCPECGCFMLQDECHFCKRSPEIICVISSPKDVFTIERTNSYNGLYHVIKGLLSPIDGKNESHLDLPKLSARIEKLKSKEVIVALDSTIEGDTTALYIKDQLKSLNVKISRLAFGLPIGSSLEYIDGGTLTQAIIGRQIY